VRAMFELRNLRRAAGLSNAIHSGWHEETR
jgi:hypothetical protein